MGDNISEGSLKSSITYWAPGTVDRYGNQGFSAPVTIKGRWEKINELFIGPGGQEERSESVVYVNQDLVSRGYLYLGVSIDIDPTVVDDAREIRAFMKIPSPSGRKFERSAML